MSVTSTGDDLHTKDDAPNFPCVNPLPPPAEVNDLVPVQRTALSVHKPKDSNRLPPSGSSLLQVSPVLQ